MGDVSVTQVLDQPGLLEREPILEAFRDTLADATAGRGQVVLLAGEAGVGKTSIVREFCRRQAGSARTLWGGCDPLFTPRPLGPLLVVGEDAGGGLEEALGDGASPHEVRLR